MKTVLCKVFRIFGIFRLFYFLNRKAKRVLVFHNVIPDDVADKYGLVGASIRFSQFKRIVEAIESRFAFSPDLDDPSTVAITFDDGYFNQYAVAFKWLYSRGIRGYLFYAGDVGKILAIDRIALWREYAPIEFIPGANRVKYWGEVLWPEYMKDGASQGKNLIARLDAIYSFDKLFASVDREYLKMRFGEISAKELDEMRNSGWTIGWHTWSHSPLSTLDDARAIRELMAPAEFEGMPISYPYGNDDLVGRRIVELTRGLDYGIAFSNTYESEMNVDKMFFPRMTLWASDVDYVDFVLSGLQFFIKRRKLLPVATR